MGLVAAGQGKKKPGRCSRRRYRSIRKFRSCTNNLGLLLWGTGNQLEAEREFREALRIQPGVAEWRLNLGRALATQGRVSEARYQMDQSVS